jgi:hypothetical protein
MIVPEGLKFAIAKKANTTAMDEYDVNNMARVFVENTCSKGTAFL